MSNWWDTDAVAPVSAPAATTTQGGAWWEADKPAASSDLGDIAKSAGAGVARGTIGIVGGLGDLREQAGKIAGLLGLPESVGQAAAASVPIVGGLTQFAPTSGDITNAVESATGPLYKPQTTAGKYAETAGEFLPALAVPESAPTSLGSKLLRMVALPAIGSETAGQLTEGTAAEPYARLAGAVLSPMAAENAASRLTASKLPSLLDSDALAAKADAAYKDPAIAGVHFNATAVPDLADSIQSDLASKRINAKLAPQTHDILDSLKNEDPINGKTFTIEDLETTRRLLGNVAGNFTNKTDAGAAMRAKEMIDGYLGTVPQSDLAAGNAADANKALLNARADYATAQRMNTIEGKVEAAENQAAVANSGQNIDNATRQRINDILKSQKLRRGYSPDEILAMQQVARGTAPGNVLRLVGNLLGGGGGLGSLASGGLAAAAGAGPAAVMVPLAGMAVKKAGNALTARNVSNLLDTVASRAPSNAPIVAARQAQMAGRSNLPIDWRRRALLNAALALPPVSQPNYQ